MKSQDPDPDTALRRSQTRAGIVAFSAILLLAAALFSTIRFRGSHVLLNVSYDASHDLFREVDAHFKEAHPEIRIRTSHAGSVEQTGSVLRGLKVDVVTLSSTAEIDSISENGLIDPAWRSEFPNGGSPYRSTIVFLVRAGNPKGIADWDDLIRRDVDLVVPSPKVSGAGRWAYLAAWVYARERDFSEGAEEHFMRQLYARESAVDKGARSALHSFMSQGQRDALITWENEAWYALGKYGPDAVQIIYPSVSIEAEPAVAVVDRIAEPRGTAGVAKAYLDFLFSEAGQKIVVKNHLRPRDETLALWDPSIPARTRLVSIEEGFGGWEQAMGLHFSAGGSYDRISAH